VPIQEFGPPVDPGELVALDWPSVVLRDGELETTVIYRDTFGNLKLAGLTAELNGALSGLGHGDRVLVNRTEMAWAQTFGDVAAGECLLYEDSYGRLCLAQNQGNAAQTLDLDEGSVVKISRPTSRARKGRQAGE
jgi:S-adenosyl-L-methionine hydrolase (adenosine-forming)